MAIHDQSITWRRVSNGLLCFLIERDDALQHADGLGQRTHVIVFREGVLVEEIFDDNVCHIHDHLEDR